MEDTGTEIDTQMPTTSGKFTDLRSTIAKAVEASVEKDKRGAVFAIADTSGQGGKVTLRFGTAIKVNDHWQVMGDLSSDVKGKHVTGRVMVAGSW